MEKEFIPYKQALALKELGFDEPCFTFYNGKFLDFKIWDNGGLKPPQINVTKNVGQCPNAPTFSQSFKWFREKYGLHTWITSKTNDKGKTVFIPQGRTIPDTIKNNLTVDIMPYYTGKSSEEAELECLKKLIEIVKSK